PRGGLVGVIMSGVGAMLLTGELWTLDFDGEMNEVSGSDSSCCLAGVSASISASSVRSTGGDAVGPGTVLRRIVIERTKLFLSEDATGPASVDYSSSSSGNKQQRQ